MRLAARLFHTSTMPEDPPQYPTYAEIKGIAAEAPVDPKAKAGGKPAAKAKGVETVERPKAPWDCDCVRLDKVGRVRIPGNQTLWNLNMSQNQGITDEGVDAIVAILESRQPPIDDPRMAEDVPKPYVLQVPLEFLHVDGDNTSAEALTRLRDVLAAMQRLAAAAAAAKAEETAALEATAAAVTKK